MENPITLNRYAYANDNPLAIIDPSGNTGWWSSITSAVSNVASTISSDLSSGATEVSNAWNSLPLIDQQAIIIGATFSITEDLTKPSPSIYVLSSGRDVYGRNH